MSPSAPTTPRLSQAASVESPFSLSTPSVSLASLSRRSSTAGSVLSTRRSSTASRYPDTLQQLVQEANAHRERAHELQQQVKLGAVPAEAQEEALAEIEELNRQEAFLRAQAAEIARSRRAERKLRAALESHSSMEGEVASALEKYAEARRKADTLLQDAACKEDRHLLFQANPEEERRVSFMAKVGAAAQRSRHKEELHKVEMEIKAEQEFLRQHEEDSRQHEEHLASIQKADMEVQNRLAPLQKEGSERSLRKQPKVWHGALRSLSAFVKSAWQQATS